jgi:hypothetical protein
MLKTNKNMKASQKISKTNKQKRKKAIKSRGPKKNFLIQEAPTAGGVITSVGKPVYVNRGSNCMIRHREYVTDIIGSSSDYEVVLNQPINPGNVNLFPWLSAAASRYESYLFKRLRFSFETSASTVTTGYVLIAVDYDPLDPPPLTKTVAFNYESSVKGAVWQCFTHNSASQNLTKRRTYFVGYPTSPSAELADWDTGNLFIATGGLGSESPIGELWVEYEVELMTPQLNNGGALFAIGNRFTGAANQTSQKPFGTSADINIAGGNLNLLTYDGTQTLSRFVTALLFPSQFLMVFQVTGVGLTAFNHVTNVPGDGSAVVFATNINAAGTILNTVLLVEFSAKLGSLDVSVTGTSVSDARVYVSPYGNYE